MRRALVCLGVTAVCLVSSSARAQSPFLPPAPPQSGGSRNVPHAVPGPESRIRKPITTAEQLIFERASHRAIERDVRMESRRWSGYSPHRPAIRHGHFANDLNRYIWTPVVGYYYFPAHFPAVY